MSDLATDLAALAEAFSGRAGIAARNLTTGEEAIYNDRERFPTASIIKILILFELFRQHERGSAQLWERVTLRNQDRTQGSGLLVSSDEGLNPTLRDLAVFMMAISDNTATNLLIDRLGRHAINVAIREAGLFDTELRHRIDFDLIRQSNDNLAVGTPRDFCDFLSHLWRGELISAGSVAEMLAIMRIQKYIEPIRRHLPYSPYAEEFGETQRIWIASKTGGLKGVRCEAGLVGVPQATYALCVMTKDCPDPTITCDHEGSHFISAVSRRVFEAWGGESTSAPA
ncbi:MAG: serine hydrolase [Armatimonadetes bacterium]|nr:serine hydrolase [Armatimonadota bacterium]